MEITIHSVARKAKVSVSTASRILNGGTKGLRSDAVKRAQLVWDAARELGYQPNAAARGLVMKRTFSIGFVGTELNNPVRSKLIETLRLVALEKGFQLLVSGVRHGENVSNVLQNMIAQRVEGLILGNIQEAAVQALPSMAPAGLSVVGFGQESGLPWDSVMIDYGGMIETLTAHLIEKHGMRRIVFAGLPVNYPQRRGYERMMRQAGLEEAISHWYTDDWSPESGRELARRQIAAGSRPEAIVCHNDMLAIGIMAGLRSCGIRVPDDVTVTGLDNIELADFVNPPLSTAGVDGTELADCLFEILYDRINGNAAPVPKTIECKKKIFFRESCGCVEKSLNL